jgi:hypothetical protein
MNALNRRIRRLETKLIPPGDEEGMRLVALLRERRGRDLPAAGREPHEAPWRENVNGSGPRPQTIAEALRYARF